MNNSRKSSLLQIVPVMLCFFAMGFVDLIGTAKDYVQNDFNMSESLAGWLPSIVFFWFFVISVPTGILMNKIGRKKTVLISLIVTTLALIIPICGDSLALIIIGFCLLGIGNAIMQTSLNPLVSNLISNDKLASTLTFGQFIKAIASAITPLMVAWGATEAIPTFGHGWKGFMAIYAIISFLSIAVLAATPIKEEKPDKASGLVESIKLLGTPFVFLCFIGIFCHVGIDVGTNTYGKKILMDLQNLAPTNEAVVFTTILYFIFRLTGTFIGAFLLRLMSQKLFFFISVLMMIGAMVIFFSCSSVGAIYTGIALVGFGNSNIFAIVFSQALEAKPKERNEVSGLMIMGLVGGAAFSGVMGYAYDLFGGIGGAIAIISVGVLYLLFFTSKIRKVV
ncbi:MAG: MFS transporter [Muribaculaceae bacterium]|nr:MFS transporter [Muribaculaceae bacterium]